MALSEQEKSEFYDLAYKGMKHPNVNLANHAQSLWSALKRYDELVDPTALDRWAAKVRSEARHIERDRYSNLETASES